MISDYWCCHNTECAKARAQRLGLFTRIEADLNAQTGTRAAAGVGRDGEKHIAVVAWAGFANPLDNGWATLSITPASNENAAYLAIIVEQILWALKGKSVE